VALGQPYSVYFYCPLSVSFHQYATLFCIYTIVLPDVQRGEAWGTSKIFQIWYWKENYFHYFSLFNGNSMNQAVSCRPVCPEANVCTRFKICKICGGQIGKATSWSFNTAVSPLSTNPPLLHTHLYLKTTLFRRTSGIKFPKSEDIYVEKFLYCLWSRKHSHITVFWLLTEYFVNIWA